MATIDNVEALEASVKASDEPPGEIDDTLKALWFTKAGRWDEAHDLAQSFGNKTGDWIHGLLHLIEGDLGNSAYWYHRAGKAQPPVSEIDAEWRRIAEAQF